MQCVFPKPGVKTNSLKFNTRTLTVFLQERAEDVICLDINRAFDRMSHNIIISKLDYYSLDGQTTKWVKKMVGGSGTEGRG